MEFFFRNDDVRNTLDQSLIKITGLFIYHEVPICHAVEPANISSEVVNWLIGQKQEHPNLIEIIQHGYDHKIKSRSGKWCNNVKGEFGGERNYCEQLREIRNGKELLDTYFGDYWFPLFTFPFGTRNDAALRAVNDAGFKVINGSISFTKKRKLFNFVAKALKKRMLFGKEVPWDLCYLPGLDLFQINVCINLIRNFYSDGIRANFYSLDELIKKTIKAEKQMDYIGVVLHHRYHGEEKTIRLIDNYINWLKDNFKCSFKTQQDLYKNYRFYHEE